MKCNTTPHVALTAMGTILPRKRKDGSMGYTALIRIKRGGQLVHTESKTFDREQAAKLWIGKREADLSERGALEKQPDPTLADVIDQYNREKNKAHGKSKTQVLSKIKGSRLGAMHCSKIDSPAIVAFAQSLDCRPQTRGNYVAHLASIFSVARPAWGYPLDAQAMADARVVLKKLNLTSRSRERSRRPTLEELGELLAHYEVMEHKRPSSLPMRRLILFAIFSTRRQEEICRVAWADLDRDALQLVVRDMKNPGEKIGNDVRTTLTPQALRLIDAQGSGKGAIWPYNSESVSTSFTRACALLGIDDLHFHDLRHEGISRLFELGWSIPQVAAVSGHRSWQSLKRYTHLRQTGDKYAGWPWFERALQS